MARQTKHISHAPPGSKVDTADLTAIGVLASIRAVARLLEKDLAGLRVAVQGLGQVGYRLAKLLSEGGARLTVADVDAGRVQRAVEQLGASSAAPEAIYDVEADVFSPNAGGGVVNGETVGRLRCRAVVGAANEQLLDPHHGDALEHRGIVYAPDYIVNAGGLLSLLFELGETDEAGVTERVRGIGDRLWDLLRRARSEGVPAHRLADRIAGERLAAARARRAAR
jgi:leucine dehydrogenase